MVIRESVATVIYPEPREFWSRDIKLSKAQYDKVDPPVYDKWLPPEPRIVDPVGTLYFKYELISDCPDCPK
jgi:hypothetical protein